MSIEYKNSDFLLKLDDYSEKPFQSLINMMLFLMP